MSDLDIELHFTDITMAETDGIFEDIKKLMNLEFPIEEKWMLSS